VHFIADQKRMCISAAPSLHDNNTHTHYLQQQQAYPWLTTPPIDRANAKSPTAKRRLAQQLLRQM